MTNVVLSGLIMLALYATSVMFDEYIDRQDLADLYDGQTAVWVAVGCLYTTIGFGLIMGVWFGWQEAVIATLLLLLCFVASGLPMYFGDAERNRHMRRD